MTQLFPFPTIRGGQREFLDGARDAMADGMHFIAHAPTGIGKTAAALTASLEYGMKNGMLTLFLTSRQSQHKIAIETLKLMKERSGEDIVVVDVIAKQSMCPRSDAARLFPGEFYEFCSVQQRTRRCKYALNDNEDLIETLMHEIHHVDSLVSLAVEHEACPYKTALDLGEFADVIVCDYNYLFSQAEDTILTRIGRGFDELVVIVDEAHNLPDRIRDHLSSSISPFDLKDAIGEVKSLKRDISPLVTRHLKSMTKIFDAFEKRRAREDEIPLSKDDLVDRVEKMLKEQIEPLSFDEFVEILAGCGREFLKRDAYRSSLSKIATFLELWPTNEGASVRLFENREAPNISYRLLDPSILSRNVFAGLHSSILMSGTLYPEMTRDILGIDKERSILASFQSPFPRKNRLILSVPGVTKLYSKRNDEMYKKIGDSISMVADHTPGNFAVFFPSYFIMASILPHVTSKKRIIKEGRGMSKNDKDKIYDLLMHLKEREGCMLAGVMGGSLAEGVDYPANVLNGVVVVGVPLSPPSIEVKSLIDFYDQKYKRGHLYGYIYPAMNKVLQAAGRCIRSEDDRGVITLMDNRFEMQKYFNCFPSDFRVIVSDEWEEMLEEFFNPPLSRPS